MSVKKNCWRCARLLEHEIHAKRPPSPAEFVKKAVRIAKLDLKFYQVIKGVAKESKKPASVVLWEFSELLQYYIGSIQKRVREEGISLEDAISRSGSFLQQLCVPQGHIDMWKKKMQL